jgi:hypothetical protein
MEIPEYALLTDEKMKLYIEDGRKRMEDERVSRGLELYTGEVEALYSNDGGAELDQLDTYNEEFSGLIEDMFQKLPMEKRILEGAEVPIYTAKTDFPDTSVEHQQWNSVLPSGCLTTAPTHTSLTGLSSSACTAELSSPSYPTMQCEEQSTPSSGSSCSEKWDDCGNEIDAMNECSECTVPMINELMDGTLSEVKWSPHLKSTESLEVTLLDVTLC